jgi:putative endonuclease
VRHRGRYASGVCPRSSRDTVEFLRARVQAFEREAVVKTLAAMAVASWPGQRFVYVLRSERDPSRHYVGRTGSVADRLRWHNQGPTGHTCAQRPWRILVAMEFADGSTAARFERYLKSGSGRAFAKRHFAPVE